MYDSYGLGKSSRRFAGRLWLIFAALSVGLWVSACSSGESGSGEPDASELGDAEAGQLFDLCDAFTSVGASCPVASPVRCFQMCDAGGCSCTETETGPQWACVTDVSCLPTCAPIDDACAPDGD